MVVATYDDLRFLNERAFSYISALNLYYKPFFDVLFATGIRARELNLSLWQRQSLDVCTLQPLKKNLIRTFDAYSLPAFFLQAITQQPTENFYVYYSTMLRLFEQSIFPNQIIFGGKSVGLHFFRYLYIRTLYQSAVPETEIAARMGYNTVVSLYPYLHNELLINYHVV